jgi:dTDP-4-amino-4,6-dideoxygalactose transaminase
MKYQLDDLALLGGPPAFSEPLHVGRPNIGNERQFLRRVRTILQRRWLTNGGRFLQEFEQRIATLLNVRHCIATCNATTALEIAIRALGLKGEVIVPSFTFVATAHALKWQEITPVFCDVNRITHTLDPASVEKRITSRTSGIVGVHLWGRACEVEALKAIADRHGLALLFDAAHALGCSHNGRMIGCFGDAEVLSFHATKFVNSFEGGAVVTNDDSLANRVRLMRNFGFADVDNVVSVGTNGKMSEVSAAMGLTSLESMSHFVKANKRNYLQYRDHLAGIEGISLFEHAPGEMSNYQYVVVEIDPLSAGVTRDLILEVLRAENVMARRYFYPGCHRMDPYRSSSADSLPATEQLTYRVLQLPTGTAVRTEDISRICDLIRFAIAHGPQLQQRMQCIKDSSGVMRHDGQFIVHAAQGECSSTHLQPRKVSRSGA